MHYSSLSLLLSSLFLISIIENVNCCSCEGPASISKRICSNDITYAAVIKVISERISGKGFAFYPIEVIKNLKNNLTGIKRLRIIKGIGYPASCFEMKLIVGEQYLIYGRSKISSPNLSIKGGSLKKISEPTLHRCYTFTWDSVPNDQKELLENYSCR